MKLGYRKLLLVLRPMESGAGCGFGRPADFEERRRQRRRRLKPSRPSRSSLAFVPASDSHGANVMLRHYEAVNLIQTFCNFECCNSTLTKTCNARDRDGKNLRVSTARIHPGEKHSYGSHSPG